MSNNENCGNSDTTAFCGVDDKGSIYGVSAKDPAEATEKIARELNRFIIVVPIVGPYRGTIPLEGVCCLSTELLPDPIPSTETTHSHERRFVSR